MVDVKIAIVSVVALFFVFLQSGIRAQLTIGSSTENDSCSQLENEWEFQTGENLRLQSVLERERMTVKTLVEENQRFKLESERHPPRSQPVRATLTGRLGTTSTVGGKITKVDDKIYVLVILPDRGLINVFEDRHDFRFIQEIALNETYSLYDIVYSNKSKCVYISDYIDTCIWMMPTTGEHLMTKWLTNIAGSYHLSLTNEGQLLVLRYQPSNQLEVYSSNATLMRSLQLSKDIMDPRHVVQTSDGNFILLHRLNIGSGLWVISQLTNDGHLIHRFIPRNYSERLINPGQLTLDSDNNRLFVTDMPNNRVILFDSSDLTWSQVLEFQGISGITYLRGLFYDASKRHLFVAQLYKDVSVYKIN